MEFFQATFPNLQNLYPGKWSILQLGNNNKLKTSDFEQYEHLAYLSTLTAENAQLAAALGNDYLVAPDVVVYLLYVQIVLPSINYSTYDESQQDHHIQCLYTF